MDAKEMQELRELIEFLKQNEIAEFELQRGEQHVKLKFAGALAAPAMTVTHLPQLQAVAAPAVPAAATASTPAASAAQEEKLHEVKSPIVGTFYESSAPGSAPFAKVGDTIEVGQVICIVEAMKLMNEIESDVAGEIVKRVVSNEQPVEYGQVLFLVRPR